MPSAAAIDTTPPPPVAEAAAQAVSEPVIGQRPEPIEPPRFDANYLDNPSPAYPGLSRRLREEGQVLLRVEVDAGGQPAQVTLHRSSGHTRLDDAAIESVRHWKFIPARQGGQPIGARVIVPIQFSLKG